MLTDLMEQLRQSTKVDEKVSVVNSTETKQIVLPDGMHLLDGARELEAIHQDQEQKIDVDRQYRSWTSDEFLVAVKNIMEKTFGRIAGKRTMFSSPTEVAIVTDIIDGKSKTQNCFYGKASIPAWEGAVMDINPGHKYVSVTAKKKYRSQIVDFYDMIEKEMKNLSIYKGKSVIVSKDNWNNISFKIYECKTNKNIVLNPDEALMVNKLVIPSLSQGKKRTYLFSGSYGNGKTETAVTVGKEAMKLGQTFFYVKESDQFVNLLEVVDNYSPCLVYIEDIDELASGADRNAAINKVLNTIDGAETKSKDFRIITTTNHAKNLNKALCRPGRLDAIISFDNPNPKTRVKIIQTILGDKLDCTTEELTELDIPDVSGAVLAELCNRVVNFATDKETYDCDDLNMGLISMKTQIKLMNDDIDEKTDETVFAETFTKLFVKSVSDTVDSNGDAIHDIKRYLGA
jgi:SpoVK/Ycf46/Vps4 family AAA+-type ATPase